MSAVTILNWKFRGGENGVYLFTLWLTGQEKLQDCPLKRQLNFEMKNSLEFGEKRYDILVDPLLIYIESYVFKMFPSTISYTALAGSKL